MNLKETLAAGHPVTGAYNVDHTLAAEEINALNIVTTAVSLNVIQWAATGGRREKIAGSLRSGSEQEKSSAGTALAMLDRGADLPIELIDIMATDNVISADDVTAYKRSKNISHAQQENLGKVRFGEIQEARDK